MLKFLLKHFLIWKLKLEFNFNLKHKLDKMRKEILIK
jgi:hypothetical protein